MNVDEIAESLEALMECGPSEPGERKPNPTQPNPTQPNPNKPNPSQPNPNQPNPSQPNPNQPTQIHPNLTQPNNQENYNNRWRQRGKGNWKRKRLERREQSVLNTQKVLLSVVTDAMASVASAVLKHTSGYQWRGGSRRGRGRGRGRGRVE
ncbi:sporozoite surface protein 2-like [Anthonomus grandis grandis]|uniref:sporozoite surface protein 2-like n=1 Tax=Anthonomus grandis grandis TaxID=2921223 RepID=UPI002165740E|nr:sporozoite surface protein 2-like [Anthonomus grandis grandis]